MGIFAGMCINQTIFMTQTAEGPPPTFSAGTLIMCSVQQDRSGRVVRVGQELAVVSHRLMFDEEPLDTTNARGNPRVRVMDRFVWYPLDPTTELPTTDPNALRTFFALGPANNEGGGNVGWGVDCQEIP